MTAALLVEDEITEESAEEIQDRKDQLHAESHELRSSIESAESFLSQAKVLTGSASDMELKQVVTALCLSKRVAKAAEVIEKKLKDVLKIKYQPMKDGKPENVKLVLEGENGMAAELRPTNKVAFIVERATKFLKLHNLYDEAVTRTTVVTDAKLLAQAMGSAVETLTASGHVEVAMKLAGALAKATEISETLDEDRIAVLLKDDKLSLTDAATFYDRETNHSVYDVTK